MFHTLFAAYRRSRLPKSIRRFVRLDTVALEARCTPAGVDCMPDLVVSPEIVIIAPIAVSPASNPGAVSNATSVRSDLFGSSETTQGEQDDVWGDWCADDLFDVTTERAKPIRVTKSEVQKPELTFAATPAEQVDTVTVEVIAVSVAAGGEG